MAIKRKKKFKLRVNSPFSHKDETFRKKTLRELTELMRICLVIRQKLVLLGTSSMSRSCSGTFSGDGGSFEIYEKISLDHSSASLSTYGQI